MNFSIKEIDLAPIQLEFKEIEFFYFESNNGGFIGCITASFDNSDKAIQLWNAIQSMTAAYLKPQGNYAKWNLYFAIFCVGKMPISNKYKIQNDKFALRKIIYDGFDNLPNVSEIQCALNKAILGTDLEIVEFSIDQVKEELDVALTHVIKDLPLDMTAVSKETRRNAIFEIINNQLN